MKPKKEETTFKKKGSKHKYDLSYWEKTTFFSQVDVAIIGSGIVGLNAAIAIKESAPSLKIIVLEQGPLPLGASTRNAGFACFGSMTELLDDIKEMGTESVLELVSKRWHGLQRLREKFGDRNIQFHNFGGYELFRESESDIYQACMEWIPFFNKELKIFTGSEATFLPADHKIKTFGFNGVQNLILNQAEGQLHTGDLVNTMLRYARNLGIEVLNGIKVKKIDPQSGNVSIITKKGWQLNAKKLIVATNGFAKQLLPKVKVVPARNQVLITQPIPNLQLKGTFHYDRGYYYFRNIDNRILLGGGRHLSFEKETTYEFGTTPLIRAALTKLLKHTILPNQKVQIEGWWSGIMGIGKTKKPIVEAIDEHTFVAVRMGGMGVAIGSLIGKEVADLVLAKL